MKSGVKCLVKPNGSSLSACVCVDPALAGRRPVRTQDRTLAGARMPTALAHTLYAHVPRARRPATL
eukprot:3640469-Ditylum_brightwellii.AAC.1